jgi:subtilisin family serine protease
MSDLHVRPLGVADTRVLADLGAEIRPRGAPAPVVQDRAPSRILSGDPPKLTLRPPTSQGYRLYEDRAFVAPEPMPSAEPAVDTLANIHQVLDLNALGPEWEGEGGLFISVDSGVAPHPDLPLADHFDNFFTDAPEDKQADAGTHGTHTTGSAIGRGDPARGGVRGAAPRARLDAVQVLDANGRGTESSVLRGLERAIEWAKEHDGFVVINLSLGGLPATTIANDPLVQTMERATREHGILFSAAAGNEGPFPGTLGRLGLAPSAVTVGALDHKDTVDPADDRIAIFSSRGNGWEGKPNIVARGVGVRSSVPGDGYATYKGTSMASGIVGGGLLALGQGLLTMYRRGELRVDPRELVRSGEFQRIVAEASYDNPRISRDAEGSGDLRLMKARELFVQRYGLP